MTINIIDIKPAWQTGAAPIHDRIVAGEQIAEDLLFHLASAGESVRALRDFVYDEELLKSLRYQLRDFWDEAAGVRDLLVALGAGLEDASSDAEYVHDRLLAGEAI